jgi:hypothetical protein
MNRYVIEIYRKKDPVEGAVKVEKVKIVGEEELFAFIQENCFVRDEDSELFVVYKLGDCMLDMS